MKNTSCFMMAVAIVFSLIPFGNLLAQSAGYQNTALRAMQVAEYIGHRGITTESAHQLYEKAYQHEVLGDYEKAIDLYSQTLMANELHEQARFNRARLCYEMGRFALAESEFDQIVERNAMDAEAFEMRGLSRFYNQKYEDAIDDFNQAFRLSGKEDILLHRGIALTKMGFYTDAMLDLDKLLQTNDKNTAAMAARGDVMLALRRYQPALHWFDKAIDLNETDAYAYCNRGIANMHLTNFEAAIVDFDRAIQLEANSQMFLNLAYCYFEMGEVELAKKYGIDAMRLAPNNVEVYYLIGLSEMELNAPDLALQSFAIVLEGDAENVEYLLATAEAHLLMNDYYAAIEHCNTILNKDHNHEAATELLQLAFDGLEKYNLEMLKTKPMMEAPQQEQPQIDPFYEQEAALIPPVERKQEYIFEEDPYGN